MCVERTATGNPSATEVTDVRNAVILKKYNRKITTNSRKCFGNFLGPHSPPDFFVPDL